MAEQAPTLPAAEPSIAQTTDTSVAAAAVPPVLAPAPSVPIAALTPSVVAPVVTAPPTTTVVQQPRSSSAVLRYSLLAVLVAVAVSMGAVLWPRSVLVSVRYPLTNAVAFPPHCTPVMPSELLAGQLMGGVVRQRELYDSLVYHMLASGEGILCAQHVGLPICYCVMRLENSLDENSKPQHYLELVNLMMTTIPDRKQWQNLEEAMECPKAYYANRFEWSVGSYLAVVPGRQEATPVSRTFNKLQTAMVSYALELQYNLPSHCGRADAARVLSEFQRGDYDSKIKQQRLLAAH